MSQGETIGITFQGERYLAPQEAAKLHNIHPQTVYYWVRKELVKTLNLAQACEGTPFHPEHFKNQDYIEETSLLAKRKESFGE